MQTILLRRCRICHRRHGHKTSGPRKSRSNSRSAENPDPSIPVLPPVEVTKGLSLDFASSLSFGQQKISSTDEIYYAHGQKVLDGSGTVSGIVPNYAQVTDVRGTFAGWTLSVATDGQFR